MPLLMVKYNQQIKIIKEAIEFYFNQKQQIINIIKKCNKIRKITGINNFLCLQ